MDPESEKRLRKGIREYGLVAPITWNRRTGNVVGGHQRLKQLDALERSDDYDLTVAVIDVDEREEAKINVQLNNPSMQGDWDLDKLADMTQEFDLSMEDMGFSKLDIDLMFDGDDRFSELYDTPEVEETKEKIDEIRAERENSRERLKDANNINWYTVIVFEDEADRADFMRKISVPVTEQYVTREQVERLAQKSHTSRASCSSPK
jgi:ParB-like chromosome segregation protein Spo0J